MGWKKGDGLGKSQTGNVDFIQIRYKNDEHGLGFNKFKIDDNWTKNETNFDDLLKSLNNQQEDRDQEQATSKKSLLEKSETSRARVHYRKRVQCKDVHKYSEKDLANILGKKSLKEVDHNAEKGETSDKANKLSNSKEVEEKSVYESLIVKSDKSSLDYFKEKLKKKKLAPETMLETPNSDSVMTEVDEPLPKKNKKKKTRKEVVPEPETTIPEDTEQPIELFSNQSKMKDERKNKEQFSETDIQAKIIKKDLVPDQKNKSDSCKRSDKPLISEDIPKGANTVYGTNLIQIPSYMANKLAKMNVDEFSNSNLANIIGYGMREDTTIRVLKTKLAENEGTISMDKYALYNNDKLITKRVNPRKILSSIKKIKKSIQVI